MGLATSAVLAYAMATGPVSAVADGQVLTYNLPVPAGNLLIAGYVSAALGTPLISGDRDLRLFGLTAAIGAAVCVAVWERPRLHLVRLRRSDQPAPAAVGAARQGACA